MAVPDYQSLMLPVVRLLHDQQEHAIRDLVSDVSDQLSLTPDDRGQRLPSGVTRTIASRTHWAVTYMAKAGLIDRVGRGRIRILPRGIDALAGAPARIDVRFLGRYRSA